ncbi:MAG TPA: tetrahydrofolate dehydrogenase/cyclohydrolase catalytic domain-containing protein [Candidatus Azoamicus sp. OHIO1]
MVAKILDGKFYANKIFDSISETVKLKIKDGKSAPCLVVILIGNDFSSNLYVKNKVIACNKVGFISRVFKVSKSVKSVDLLNLIKIFNNDSFIHGILIQLPLPDKLNTEELFESISPFKDVDLLSPLSFGRYVTAYRNHMIPCTPAAVMVLLKSINIDLSGLTASVIGMSNIVGKPLIFELLKAKISVIVVSKYCLKFLDYIKFSDIIVSAVGKPGLISGRSIKNGSIVIDVGINSIVKNKVIGDVDFETARNIAGWITPVPGGVGPLTISKLLENTLNLYLSFMCK